MDFEQATEKALSFRDEREWQQFHNLKDLAVSISIEAAELLEVFQWSGSDLAVEEKSDRAKEELADIIIYCIYFADKLGVNVADIVNSKIDINNEKYPADSACGNSRKYTEL